MLNRTKLAAATTSESDDNTEILAKQECVRLTKQLRLMENDRRAYLEESKSAIDLQKKIAVSLEKENAKVTDELRINKEEQNQSKENERSTLSVLARLMKLDEEYLAEDKRASEEAQRLSLIYQRVEKLESQLEQAANGSNRNGVHIGRLGSKLFQMKKKLETVTRQFDALVASNSQIRTKIDELLEEHVSITKKLTQLEGHLGEKKAVAHELVQEATAAYDQREESSSKMTALSERSLKEMRQFTLEMGELTRVSRNEEKLLNFLSAKNKDRIFLETDEERISRVELAKEQIFDQALELYRENFEKLLTNSSPTFTALVEEYTELHHSNIRQFAQINELTTEIENLQNDTAKLRHQIRKYSAETVQVNLKRKSEIEIKQKELEEVKADSDIIGHQFKTLNLLMGTLVKLIEQIFHLTDQTESISVLELVGTGPQNEINSENMVLYTSILEQRLKEVMKLKSENDRLLNGVCEPSPSPFILSPLVASSANKALSDIVSTGKSKPRIMISEKASSEHGYSSDGEIHYELITSELNPLTYSNMRSKILESVSSSASRAPSRRSSISEHSGADTELK